MMQTKPRIDLIWLAHDEPPPTWALGEVWAVAPAPGPVRDIMQRLVTRSDAAAFLFWSGQLGAPDAEAIAGVYTQPGNLWHAGLRLGMGGQPGLMDFVRPTWMFNCDPDPTIEATSWRLSLDACLIQRDVLDQMGGVSAGFHTLAGAALELGHRYITQGVLTRHVPQMVPASAERRSQPVALPFADELRFALMRFGRSWAMWALARAILSGYVMPNAALSAWREVYRGAASPVPTIFNGAGEPPALAGATAAVSVIIPTIDRYPYLQTLLGQLGEQTTATAEIIVVDQTPAARRDAGLYAAFSGLPLRVIYQEQAGQCTSRNRAIRESTGDYILFLDDDDEIPPDLIEKHLNNLNRHRVDVSCGAADEVGAGPLPAHFTYRRASDVFPTNNSLIRRDILCDSGLFDLAYNTGQRADGDLGMRVYLSGKAAIYNPDIRVLHHHAPRGGLRTHKARVITYASSRQKLTHRHLPSVSEIYLMKRYFTPRQVRESLWLRVFGTFAIRGGLFRKLLKVLISTVCLPHTLYEVRKRVKAAGRMLQEYPQIPTLLGDKREAQQAPSSCR